LATISCGKGEEVVDVVEVVVEEELGLLSSVVVELVELAEVVEAEAVWFPPWVTVTVCVCVWVFVFVTVGVVVCASSGEGGLAGEKSDFVIEAMPAIMETMTNARPALSRFLRVMLRSLAVAPAGVAACVFASSSFELDMFSASRP